VCNNVPKVSKRVSKNGRTDIDVVIRENGNLVYLQCKRSTDALRYGKQGLDNAMLWVQKAMKDLATQDYSRIKYVVPPGTRIPPRIETWFEV